MRARLRLLFRTEAEARMEEEIRFHLQMETEKYLREGLSPQEARRRAVLAFGGVEGHKEAMRDGRTFGWASGLSLDLRLGLRMLAKYPGLTLVGSLAITFAIWVGVGIFEFGSQVVFPKLPFDDGDRVVGIRSWDAAGSEMEMPGLHDFVTWRGELRSLEELGAYRTVEHNLITGDGRGEPIHVAEISASAFRVTRVPALLGRTLTAADEEKDAPPVVVLGHDVWQRRFAGDPGVVGRVVRLGRQQATVVGVMPEGFGFPVAHSVWAPLRLNALEYERGEEPAVAVFGRLAPGASLKEAQAELAALGLRTAADFPESHQHLRPRVMPFPSTILDLRMWMSLGLLAMNGFIIALLVLVCGNVALLMFARAAARESEIVVRNALGASRGRIVAQLFAEALVLAALAGTFGLAVAGYGLRWGMRIVESEVLEGGRLPFWFHGTLSPGSVVYAVVLTVLAAAIAGVLPALKMTGTGLEGRLRERGAGGGGPRFGGLWTAVIVTQVAVTIFFPVITFYVQRDIARIRTSEVGFAAEQYLSTRLELDREATIVSEDTSRAAFLAHVEATHQELEQRLLDEPAVAGVTFGSNVPRRYHDWNQIEVDEGAVVPLDTVRGHRVSKALISPDYFDVLGTQLLSGRGFHPGDMRSGAHVVIANQRFVEKVLGGKNAIGRRVRYVARDGWGDLSPKEEPWYEIVGVAPDLGMTSGYGTAGLYHPMTPDAASSAYLVVRVRGEPEALAPTLQRLAAAVDPTLRLHDILPLDEVDAAELAFYDFWLRLTGLLTAVALILSWAGIYAVMSFTVSRRTREIGIRVALGGRARHVVLSIFRRPLAQVTLGVVLGTVVLLALRVGLSDPGLEPSAREVAVFVGYAAVMLGVCLLACVVPTRRALAVEPTEALRAE
jgi:putative ABC transport system permease protein